MTVIDPTAADVHREFPVATTARQMVLWVELTLIFHPAMRVLMNYPAASSGESIVKYCNAPRGGEFHPCPPQAD